MTIGDLLGQPILVEDEEENDDVPAVRDALMAPRRLSRTLFSTYEGPELDPAPVALMSEAVWADFQAGRLGKVIGALPGLISVAQQLEDQAAAQAAHSRAAWSVSARVHHLAASTLAKIGEADLAWLSAERAMHAADQADDPLVLASAATSGTHALLAVGRYDDAMRLGSTAADWLTDRVNEQDPAALSLLGMLHLRSAVASARQQDRTVARDLLRQAEDAATRLGHDANYWQTGFGPTNVKLHELSTALDLGDVAHVVEEGPNVAVTELPTERAASHLLDVARAMSYLAKDDEALSTLLDAERLAPQLVRHSSSARETVRTMHRRAPATAARAKGLRALAERCRAVR